MHYCKRALLVTSTEHALRRLRPIFNNLFLSMLFITLFTANQIALQKTKKIALKSRLRFVCSAATYVTQFGGDLEQKRLDLECPSRLKSTYGGDSQV